jgi:EAL domain-containing protein (putative c-di-GMP-specific phosphodiesterase class I)
VLFAQELRAVNKNKNSHYELLVRMIGEQGEIIPPMAFIPAAERYGLMVDIDKWVVKKAFTEAEEGHLGNVDFSINISGQTISDPGFLGYVKGLIEINNINPGRCWFEITETAMVSNFSCAEKFITELKKIGCHFALDDFGSGLSSFSYLKNLNVDCLKIDGSIVKGIANDPVSREMIASIKRISNVMGIETVAEYVEDEEIYNILAETGIDYLQGYFIDRPSLLSEKGLGAVITPKKNKAARGG